MQLLRAPWLVVAFVADLTALVVLAIFAGVDAAAQLKLGELALVLGAALAGAHAPIGSAD